MIFDRNRSKLMNAIDSNSLERNAAGNRYPRLPIPLAFAAILKVSSPSFGAFLPL
jgi:hypothetical protein